MEGQEIIRESMYSRTVSLQSWLEKPKRTSESNKKCEKVLGFYGLQLLGSLPEYSVKPINDFAWTGSYPPDKSTNMQPRGVFENRAEASPPSPFYLPWRLAGERFVSRV